jgi:hypothetical protein
MSRTKCEWAHRGHHAGIESVVVHFTDPFTVIPDESPEVEWGDGQWVVATE